MGPWEYWGKAQAPKGGRHERWHLLPLHCLDVAAVAQRYLQRAERFRRHWAQHLGWSEEVLTDWVVFFVALHDLGKFSATFQSQCAEVLAELQDGRQVVVHQARLLRRSRRRRRRIGPMLRAITGHPIASVRSCASAWTEVQGAGCSGKTVLIAVWTARPIPTCATMRPCIGSAGNSPRAGSTAWLGPLRRAEMRHELFLAREPGP